MRLAAGDITRVSLELGGKSANLVFDDLSDDQLDACVASSLWSVFDNAGQDCCARSRMFVARVDRRRLHRAVRGRHRGHRAGRHRRRRHRDGAAHHRRASATSVEDFVTSAEGRRRPPPLRRRAPRPPRPLPAPRRCSTDAALDMRFMREEIFGPVVGHPEPSTPRTRPSPWPTTRSTACRARSGAATSAGRCGWPGASRPACCRSTPARSVHVEAPFGGMKQSGIGPRAGHGRPRPLHRAQDGVHRGGLSRHRTAGTRSESGRRGARPVRSQTSGVVGNRAGGAISDQT